MTALARTRGDRGLTLPEILVSAAILTVLIGAAIMVYNLSHRYRGVTTSARSLQTATMIEEVISTDLRRVVQAGPSPVRFWPDRPSRLAFLACDTDASKGKELKIRAVRYSLDKAPGMLQREWDGQARSVGLSPLTSISFLPFAGPTGPMVRVTLDVGRDPDEPAGEPIAYSFLTPIASPRQREPIPMKLVTGFVDKEDGPATQRLPDPGASARAAAGGGQPPPAATGGSQGSPPPEASAPPPRKGF
ncbi:MAG: prepilin-type N-terminal cleavage/methylation domain-containing protein [Candidatus Riflebacteria bacterium]|nr:prepilin-type N-terminal cleavage/methylation domain-containing protein [Candidatus Riflebacteria bacterium]